MTSSGENSINVTAARRLVAEEQARIEASLAYLDWRGSRRRLDAVGSGHAAERGAGTSPARPASDTRGWRIDE